MYNYEHLQLPKFGRNWLRKTLDISFGLAKMRHRCRLYQTLIGDSDDPLNIKKISYFNPSEAEVIISAALYSHIIM
mgnify:CR=1 FL=1